MNPAKARTGRRAGDSGTRDAILNAARAIFAESGYDGTTIRKIAADAGVDPALVHHFYGTKERLFVDTMRFPAVPSDTLRPVLESNRRQLGETVVRTLLAVWDDPHFRGPALGLLRSAVTNEQAARMLRQFIASTILALLARTAKPEDAELRSALVASQVLGLLLARFVLELEPLASASTDELVRSVGPTFQRYLTGDIRRGH
jgi:AcrR family transcriptional regulator